MKRLIPFVLAAAMSLPAFAEEPGRSPAAKRRTPVVEAVEKAAPAVVSIGTTRLVKVRYWDWDFLARRNGEQEQRGLGSGVIVHPSGYVVTNAHVINQADQILVKLTGDRESEPEIPATLIAADLANDLALLRLEKPGPYPFVGFGRSDDLLLGETVIAIGNPFGLGRTVTTGIISAVERTINVRETAFRGLIQTDAAVNRGNSGGPLVNIAGEWIGVNSAIYSLSGGADGISFAIPVDVVRKFLFESLRKARIGGRWLGLQFGQDGAGRVVVERVFPAGPAERAGVTAGTRISGGDDGLRFVFDLLDASKSGRITLTVDEAPQMSRRLTLPFEAPPTDELAWKRLGMRCVAIDDAISERTGHAPGSGLLVVEVRRGGPAEDVGLEPGDLLIALGDTRLTGADELLGAILGADRGESRDVRLVRVRATRFGTSSENWRARIVFE